MMKARLSEASRRLSRLLEDVERDRDQLVANSLTLRFVWHQAEHPHPGQLWELGYVRGEWWEAGQFFGRMDLPTNLGPTSYDCRIYLVSGNAGICDAFTRYCREAEAIFGRMAGDGTRFNWVKELFDTFQDAVDEAGRDAVAWRENEEPGQPETWSYVAELSDVFEWTRILLKAFRDGAELRQQTQVAAPDDAQLGGTPISRTVLATSRVDAAASVEDRALAVLVVNPEWTNAKIASAIGTHRKYLSSKNCSRFKAARKAIRESSLPSGTKAKDGTIEAEGDELDFDAMDDRMKNRR